MDIIRCSVVEYIGFGDTKAIFRPTKIIFFNQLLASYFGKTPLVVKNTDIPAGGGVV